MSSFLIIQIWNHGSQRHSAEAESCVNEKGVTREKIWAVVFGNIYIYSLSLWSQVITEMTEFGRFQSDTSQIFAPPSIPQFSLIVSIAKFCTSIVREKWRADLHAFSSDTASKRFSCGGSSFLFHCRELWDMVPSGIALESIIYL